MSDSTNETEALLARIADQDAEALRELIASFHSWIEGQVEAELHKDSRHESRESPISLTWDVEGKLRNALLRYAREGKPTLTKKEFTGLVLKIVKNTLALLTRKLQRQGADLEAPDREAGTSPAITEAMAEQHIAEYLDTLQGKRKAVAHAVLRLHLTSGKIAATFHVSRRKATGYRIAVKSEFAKFLAGDRRSEASVLEPAERSEEGVEGGSGSRYLVGTD